MSEHAQEPWKTRASSTGFSYTHICNAISEEGIACGESEADMRRIVACVNACAGVSNDELSMTSVRVLLDKVGAGI